MRDLRDVCSCWEFCSCFLQPLYLHFRFDEGKTAENGASGSGGIALIELEKAHPIKALERVLPASEQVELKYAGQGIIHRMQHLLLFMS